MQKKFLLPPTTKRVQLHTDQQTNNRIAHLTEVNIFKYKNKPKHDIRLRLSELEYEWDTERTLETSAGALALVGTLLGSAVWYILPGVVGFFLLQHAIQGWCPPLTIIRKLGVRTAEEINIEKKSLLEML